MNIEPIGIATVLVGLFCLFLGNGATVWALAVASVFGSAAAVIVGGANIQPGHVILGFLALGTVTRREEMGAFLDALRPGTPAFWFLALVAYGIACAYFSPRLLAGATQIVPLGTTVYGDTGSTVPLAPVSSNLTQSLYMIGDLLCLAMISAVARTQQGFDSVVVGLVAYSAASMIFVLIDIGTFSTGTQSFLSFMRNAQYTLHTEEQVAGMKRIVGSFTEASAFARSTLGVLAFTGTLWLCGYRPLLTGLIAAASVVLLVLSTSSTGLAGVPIVLLLLYATALSLFGRTRVGVYSTVAVVFAPMLLVAAMLVIAIDKTMSTIVFDYVDLVVLGKESSDSGIERNFWNVVAYQNFFDSFGFGVGIGTVRTSSFLLALLAGLGVPGALFYGAFAVQAFMRKHGPQDSFMSHARLAARNGCLGLLLGDVFVSPVVDQGLFFYMLAALAAAAPERRERAPFTVGAVA